MVTWRTDEFTLTTFHLRPAFLRDVLDCMIPWIRLVTDQRRAIYLNSIDPARKDQWLWMKRYENMLVEKLGEPARFLPPDEAPPNAKRTRSPARPDAPEPPEFVDFE